jgi:Plavaka transposase
LASLIAAMNASLPPIANSDNAPSIQSRTFHFFRTPRNLFGMSRQYFSDKLPIRDPDQLASLGCDEVDYQSTSVQPDTSHRSDSVFFPYPNKNSFRLGEWFWNGGEKSQDSFRELLDIVGDPYFQPSDVRHTKWSAINAVLASNELEDEDEWTDVTAGWTKRPISFTVPFHQRTESPGSRQYTGGELFHRPLVKVITERLTDPRHAEHFHYEPYRLIWQPTDQQPDVRLHGELYTSEAFFKAHQELQTSPGEPNCSLPRVVVALMFWSDATHLTSFGNAKLWPLYMFFGNESKYRRCKPSCDLCCHVAYFENVRAKTSQGTSPDPFVSL